MTSAVCPLARSYLLRTQAKQALFRPRWWAAIASSLLFACANTVTPGVAATPQIAVASADSQHRVLLADKNSAPAPVSAPLTFLHDDRMRIVDAAGNAVQLRGVDLGGWLLWEAWIWEGDINALNLPAQAETNIRKQLTKLVGPEEFPKFDAIAQRYRDRSGWAAYDLLNEPKPTSSDLVALYARIVAGVRQVHTKHMVMLQGKEFALDFSPFTARLDANEAYTFHVYNWFDALTGETTLGKVQQVRSIANAHGLPLWNGEFGQDQYSVVEANRRIFERSNQSVSGWAYYTWKNAPNKYPHLYAIGRRSNAWRNVISWITAHWQHRQPSKEDTLIGMREFLEDIKLQNCSVDVKMLQGLINR